MKHLISIAALVATGLLFVGIEAGFGAGEPKNQPPFTRQVTSRTLQVSRAYATVDVRGEAKNQLPFTRLVRR